MEARHLIRLAKKWLWLVVLAGALGGAAGLFVGLRQPQVYQADTTLIVSTPNRSDWNALAGDQQAAKGFTLVPKSTPVLAGTIQAINDPKLTIADLSAMVTVDYTRDTQFIVIHVRNSNAAMAAKLSNEIARQSVLQYEKVTSDGITSRKFMQDQLQQLETQIGSAQKEFNDLQAQNIDPSNDLAVRNRATRLKELNDTLGNLRQSYNQLVNAYYLVNNTQPKVLQEAEVPGKPLGAGPMLGAVIGLLAGLVVIVGVIVLVEMTDEVVRTPERVAQISGLTTLVAVKVMPMVPRVRALLPGRSGAKDKKLSSDRLNLVDDFLTLGAYLRGERSQLVMNGTQVNSLLVTSPEKGDGKTLTASQIAIGLARTGTEVVLVDANLHNPTVHEMFGLSNKVGLSNVLNNPQETTLADVLQFTSEPNLAVLPGGPVVDAPAELLSSAAMGEVINRLREGAFVVIDSPSVLGSSEPIILASKSDAVLMVVNATHTSAPKFKRSLEIMTPINLNILGVVLNRASRAH